MNPFIIFLAIPALCACLSIWWRRGETLALLAVVWFLGSFLPAVFESYALRRVNYLYYMLIVMPGDLHRVGARIRRPAHAARWRRWHGSVMLVFGFADAVPDQDASLGRRHERSSATGCVRNYIVTCVTRCLHTRSARAPDWGRPARLSFWLLRP